MKTVFGYIRVSTAKQGEGVSLIAQQEAITQYASKYNLSIVQWFEEKETAAKQGRPLFNAMIKLLKDRKADGVIIHKIDRSARNLKDWADLGNLIDQGVEVHFAHESLDLQARGGRLSADIQAVIAADYIRNLRQEAIKGIYGRLNQGILPFQAPIGYINNGKGKCKTIDPVQGALVRKAFELYATRQYTLKTLVAKMRELGLRNTAGSYVNRTNLSIMLNNPFYMGIIRVKKSTFNGMHEPLISPKQFNQVQAILRGNTNQKVVKHKYKLQKLISCKACGYSLTAEIQKGHIYYRCHSKGCITKGIRETTLETLLLKKFEITQLMPEECAILEKLLYETEQQWTSKHEEMITALKLQKDQLGQQLERLTDCYVEGGLDKSTYEQRKEKLLVELKSKQAAETEFDREKDKLLRRAENFFEQSKSLKKSYENGNREEQRRLVELTTSNMVAEGKNVIIAMRSPFRELAERHFLTECPPERTWLRKHGEQNANVANLNISSSDIEQTAPQPLSTAQLKNLFDNLLMVINEMPEFENIDVDGDSLHQ